MLKKCVFLVMFILALFSFSVRAEIVERIVAVVEGEVITLSELKEFMGPAGMSEEGIDVDIDNDKMLRQALDSLIEKNVLLREAKDMDVEVRESNIERRLEEIKKKFVSEKEFHQVLHSEHLTEMKLRKRIEEDLMIGVLIDTEVRGNVRVGDEEVRQFYDEHKEEFKGFEEVELSHILIKAGEGDGWREGERKGEKLLGQLKEGADFFLLAQKFSQGPNAGKGGKLGFFTLGELNPEFEEAVTDLNIGEFSGLIKMADGFHIIKLESRKPSRELDLPEVRDRIESLLFMEKVEKKYRQWVEELREKTYIEIKL